MTSSDISIPAVRGRMMAKCCQRSSGINVTAVDSDCHPVKPRNPAIPAPVLIYLGTQRSVSSSGFDHDVTHRIDYTHDDPNRSRIIMGQGVRTKKFPTFSNIPSQDSSCILSFNLRPLTQISASRRRFVVCISSPHSTLKAENRSAKDTDHDATVRSY